MRVSRPRTADRLSGTYLGHVTADTDPLERIITFRNRNDPHDKQPVRAVRGVEPELGIENSALLNSLAPGVGDPVTVLGMHPGEPPGPSDLREALAGDGPPPRHVHVQGTPGTGMKHVRVPGLRERPVPGLSAGQLVTSVADPGDICGHESHTQQHAMGVRGRKPAHRPDLRRL